MRSRFPLAFAKELSFWFDFGLYVVPFGSQLQGFSFFFQDWWAEVTHGAKNGESFSEMMGSNIPN